MSNETLRKTFWGKSRSFSRTSALASALALVAILAAGSLAQADTVVRQVSGTVELGRGEPPVWAPLTVGTRVAPDERIRTGADGRVELTVDAATLRVHENSLLKLPGADASSDRVELERGHSLFDVLRRAGRSFEVRTPSVVVSVKGTRFGVEAGDGSGIVSVYRGVVGVRPASATDVLEVLVREGFLATAGDDRPIELDLTPEGDPWSDWQDLRSAVPPRVVTPPRESEVDRARTSVRRAVDVDVLKRAAERKPEIAERLREQVGDSKDSLLRDLDTKDATSGDSSMPASPAVLDGLEPVEDSQREILDSSRGEEELERFLSSIDLTRMTGGEPLPNGETTLSLDSVSALETEDLVRLVDGLAELESSYDASSTTGSSATFESELERVLVDDGLDPTSAERLIDSVIGTLAP